MTDVLAPAETFSPILIEEYIRLMTAVHYLNTENKSSTMKFMIAPDVYEQITSCPIQAPLIGLTLNYNKEQGELTVSANEAFLKMYENKIQAEVAQNFAFANTQRYSKWISVSDTLSGVKASEAEAK